MTQAQEARAPVDALMLLGTHCPHCPAVLAALSDLVKQGVIASLEVVNIEQKPELAQRLGVRSVPWVRIGPVTLTGLRSKGELQKWAQTAATPAGITDWFEELLNEGRVSEVLRAVEEEPSRLSALMPIVANPDAKINARLGAGAVLEDYEDREEIGALVPHLSELAAHADARVRSDACHYLSLTHDPSVRSVIESLLSDEDADVREVAEESLEAL